MNTELARFLIHNKDEIIESWLAELEIPAPLPNLTHGEVSYDFLEDLYEELISLILLENETQRDHIPFHAFLDYTFTCLPGKPACVELHRAGNMAMKAALERANDWGSTLTARECATCKKYLENALAIILHRETDACCKECAKPFCPFAKTAEPSFAAMYC